MYTMRTIVNPCDEQAVGSLWARSLLRGVFKRGVHAPRDHRDGPVTVATTLVKRNKAQNKQERVAKTTTPEHDTTWWCD